MKPKKFTKRLTVVLVVTLLLGVLIMAGFTPAALSDTPKAVAAGVPANVTVTPVEATNPIKTQHTLTATVTAADGSPVEGADVEWILNRFPAAVGDIVSVSNGMKIDNTYAMSTTDAKGTATMTITATREGDTDITVYVPGIADASKHKVFAVKHWVDMMVEWPPDGTNKIGTEHTFAVRVYKATDGSPLNDVDVRWTITDDLPDAKFKALPNGIVTTVTKTNATGTATIAIEQADITAGENTVKIEILRGNIVLYQHDAKKTWLSPALNILKDGPATAEVGAAVAFTITVSNNGQESATGVMVTDQVPGGLTFVNSTPAGTVAGSTVTWNIGTLAQGASSVIIANFTAAQKGDWTNTATVTSLEGLTAQDTAPIQITGEALLTITKTGPATVVKGEQAAYTITVTNTGKIAAANTVLTDSIPAGMSYAASTPLASRAGNTATWNLGTLKSGASSTFTITLNADAVGTHTNHAAATATDVPRVEATAITEVLPPKKPDVSIIKTGANAIYIGQNGQFTITVTNTGEVTLTSVIVTDSLPANLSYVSSSPVGTVSGRTITWVIPSLAIGQSQDITIVGRGDALGIFTNSVTVTTAEGVTDTDIADGEVIGKTGVTIQMTDTVDPIAVGATTIYQISITNQSAVSIHNAKLTVALPGEVNFVNATGATNYTTSGQQVIFDAIATLTAGRTVNYTITVTANAVGDALTKATLTYDEFSLPIITEEGTTIFR